MGKHHRRSDSSDSEKRHHKKHHKSRRSPSYSESSDDSYSQRKHHHKRDRSIEKTKHISKKHKKRSRSPPQREAIKKPAAPLTREEMIRIEQEKRRRGDRYSSSRSSSRDRKHKKREVSPKRVIETAKAPIAPPKSIEMTQ